MSGKLARYVLIASTAIVMAVPSTAALASSRTTKGALIGAGVGLLSGNGIKGALGGAVAGAGVGAMTESGKKGKKSRKGAKVGAVVGAGVGLLAGDGLDGAIKGAAAGAVGGSLLGRVN